MVVDLVWNRIYGGRRGKKRPDVSRDARLTSFDRATTVGSMVLIGKRNILGTNRIGDSAAHRRVVLAT